MNIKRTLFTSMLTILLCISIIAGGTYALFTDTETNDIVVSSGKVDVTAALSADSPAVTTSLVSPSECTVSVSNDGNIIISGFMPGDTVHTTLTVKNVGTVAAKYRVKLTATAENGAQALASVIDTTIGNLTAKTGIGTYASAWTDLAYSSTEQTTATWPITIALPEAVDGTQYQDQTVTYRVTVEAVQGNANVTGAETFTLINGAVPASAQANAEIVATTDASLAANVAPAGGNNTTTVDIPAGALGTTAGSATLSVDTYDVLEAGNFTVTGDNGTVAGIDLTLVVSGTNVTTFAEGKPVTVTTYIAKGLSNVNVVYNGAGAAPTEVTYNETTGELSFKTTHFSQFLVTSDSVAYIKETGTAYANLQGALDNASDGYTIVMLNNVTQDDGYKVDKASATINLDLNGKTITVNSGSKVNYRAIRIDNGTLNVYNGSIVAVGSGTTSSNGTGCYGAFRVEADGKLIATDLTLTNARPWGLNVKVLGGEAELTRVTVNSSYGGGIEVTEADLGTQSKIGKATLTDCKFTQTGYYDHCSTTLSVSGGSELTVNSGSYIGDNYALYVFSSGGVIKVNGGTFSGGKDDVAIIAMIDTNTYPEYTGGLEISGGTFTGGYSITSPAYMSVKGGTFNVDPTAYLANGYTATGSNDTWTVTATAN